MKQILKKAVLAACSIGLAAPAMAGNKDRSGQAGATELLINPWGQSTGVFGMDVATVRGIQAMKVNIAGLSHTDNLEIGASHNMYLAGSGVAINDAGFAYRVGESSVIGVNVMSMTFGDIAVTDGDHPEGTGEKYNPQFLNVSIGFAKEFSRSIHAGVNGTFISEQIGNVGAVGGAIDAGIQYVTGKRDNFHIGITLRNAGTNMRFSGGGFSSDSQAPDDPDYTITRQDPTEKFQLPTYLALGAAYDFFLDEGRLASEDATPKHRLTVLGNFTSNSFNNDYIGVGAEYAFMERFMARAAYRYERDINDAAKSQTFYTGYSFGVSVVQKANATSKFAFDYSFRPTHRPDNGVHVFSLRYILGKKKAAEETTEE